MESIIAAALALVGTDKGYSIACHTYKNRVGGVHFKHIKYKMDKMHSPIVLTISIS